MSNNERADQDALNLDTIVTAKRVRNTTSASEKRNGSENHILVIPVEEIFKFNVEKNLRVYFGEKDAARNRTPIHREIYESFLEDPGSFIQKNSGFTVVCDNFESDNKGDYGISKITLRNASLINGAQSQGELKRFFDDGLYDKEHKDAEVRVEVIVEKNKDLQVDIANARNSSTNVTNLSKMGGYNYFEDLEKSMLKYNPEWKLQKSETDPGIPTQTLLQAIRTMMPRQLRDSYKKLINSEVRSYSGKAAVLTEFKLFKDNDLANKIDYTDVYEYYISFAPHAWEEYLKWNHDFNWVAAWKKNQKIGKYDEKSDKFELSWGILCPFLYGLQNFVTEDKGKWTIKYDPNFNSKAYMKKVLDMFKSSDSNPQTFAKDRSTYLELYIGLSELK